MSKIIYIVSRTELGEEEINRVEQICKELNADNITPAQTKIFQNARTIVGIINPSPIMTIEGVNVLFGQAFGKNISWNEIGGSWPDGNYAIFRSKGENFEVVSDILGTKTIWYYQDNDIFIASSSQRAIIQYTGKFDFNDKVVPWMLCNGLLGPDQGWDIRIKKLPPDTCLTLNLDSWSTTLESGEVNFRKNSNSDIQNEEKFNNLINSVFSNLSLDYSKWTLSLSGGYDSRGILLSLPKIDQNGHKLKTVTWGLNESIEKKGSDAFVAKKISKKFSLPHQYFSTDTPTEDSLDVIINRFLKNGEGRIDHISGYMDGFHIWKKLFESGVHGIIRGDEVFGSYDFVSEFHMKKFIGLSIPNDYDNLKKIQFFKKYAVGLPESLQKREVESFETWRDRLYHSYLVPVFLSSLEDLKQPYLEQLNPLLSKEIVNFIRELPDHLRTEKRIFKQYVNSQNFEIPYATSPSIKPMKNIFRAQEMVHEINNAFNSKTAKSVFPEEFLTYVLAEIQVLPEKEPLKIRFINYLKSQIPKRIKQRIMKKTYQPNMDMNLIGFRVLLICRMIEMLEGDSKLLEEIKG